MIVSVTARGFKLTEALYEHVVDRLQHSLARFEHHVEKVEIVLGDPQASTTGGEAFCNLAARVTRIGNVRVEDTDPSLYVAIDSGCGRLKQAVSRKLDRFADHAGAQRLRAGGTAV